MFHLTLAILLVLLGFIGRYVYVRRLPPEHHKNGQKLPPGPRALPIIGNLHMLGNLPHQKLHHLAKRYGNIMSMKLGHKPTIVVSSPQAAKLFLKTHDNIFASRPKFQASDLFSYGTRGLIFKEYGSYWRNARKLCTSQLLSASKIESFSSTRRVELELMVHSLKKAAVAGDVVDFSKKICILVQNMNFRMIFGQINLDEFDLTSPTIEFLILAGAFNIADYLPCLAALDLQGLARKLKKCSQAMDEILENIIDEHEQVAYRGKDRQLDFVDVLLSLMNKPMDSHNEPAHVLDRTTIKAIITDMIIAAFDTSATIIEWIFSELVKHPRVMKRLQEELGSVVGMNRMVEEKDLMKLKYLDMVIKESFRLHPVVPLLIPHESMEDITINGYYIPKKSRILVNTWSMGRDPEVWSDNAQEFVPERFEDTNIDLGGNDFELIPFGSGRRGCPGIQLGLTIVRLIVAQLVHCFNWELPNGVLPGDLDMSEKSGLTMPRAYPLLLVPTYRINDN